MPFMETHSGGMMGYVSNFVRYPDHDAVHVVLAVPVAPPDWTDRLHDAADGTFRLSVSVHHSVIDGWSFATLMTDLLLASADDVRIQHNNLAAATGHPDRL